MQAHFFVFYRFVDHKVYVNLASSVSYRETNLKRWRNSLRQKFGKDILYRLAFALEDPMREFQSIPVSNLRIMKCEDIFWES